MNSKTKSILESLVELAPANDTSLVIESRGTTLIHNAIQLLETVNDIYGETAAADLEKRLLSSIKNRNNKKFIRGTKSLTSKNN